MPLLEVSIDFWTLNLGIILENPSPIIVKPKILFSCFFSGFFAAIWQLWAVFHSFNPIDPIHKQIVLFPLKQLFQWFWLLASGGLRWFYFLDRELEPPRLGNLANVLYGAPQNVILYWRPIWSSTHRRFWKSGGHQIRFLVGLLGFVKPICSHVVETVLSRKIA